MTVSSSPGLFSISNTKPLAIVLNSTSMADIGIYTFTVNVADPGLLNVISSFNVEIVASPLTQVQAITDKIVPHG